MKKTSKPNPLKTFNDNKAMAYKKAGGAMAEYKKYLKKAQPGLSTGTPFQNYLETAPGAVPSDTVMQTMWPGDKWDYPKKPVAKNPKNQNLLEQVYEQTYGQGWRSEDRKADDETFEQYKRRMGPLSHKMGGAAKNKMTKRK